MRLLGMTRYSAKSAKKWPGLSNEKVLRVEVEEPAEEERERCRGVGMAGGDWAGKECEAGGSEHEKVVYDVWAGKDVVYGD